MVCRVSTLLAALSLLCPASSLAQADSFDVSLTNARERYTAGEYNEAIRALNAALTQAREQQLVMVKQAFPQPLPNWTSSAPEGEFVATTVFRESGITARRSYEGAGNVQIMFMTGSPMVHSKQLAMENPVLLSWSGSPEIEITTIQGQKAVTKWLPEEKMGEINIVVEDTLLILLGGSAIASMEPLEQYAAGIDYAALKSYLGR